MGVNLRNLEIIFICCGVSCDFEKLIIVVFVRVFVVGVVVGFVVVVVIDVGGPGCSGVCCLRVPRGL